MTYKAVLFDLDGTLLDTIEDLADSMNSVLQRSRLPVHNTASYKYFVGNGLINLVKMALPEENRDEESVYRFLSQMNDEYSMNWDKKTHPYVGVPELLDELVKGGIKLSVLSNKADVFTQKMIAKFLSRWKFEVVFGERKSVPRKPDPSAAIEIASIMGVSPKDFLYLGDSGVDMQTANAAGMFAIGALWGFRTEGELVENGAKAVISNPKELLKLL